MEEARSSLASMQAQYEEVSQRLKAAQRQAEEAEKARDNLQRDVKDLEEQSRKLRENIVTIREGNVVFRSGEILFSGSLQGGLSKEETQKEMEAGALTEACAYCENQMFRAYFNALGAEKAAEAKAQLGQLCPVGFLLGGKRRKIPKKQG